VFWSDSGETCILACDTSYYVLKFNREIVDKFVKSSTLSRSLSLCSFPFIAYSCTLALLSLVSFFSSSSLSFSFFFLSFSLSPDVEIGEQGIENAFEVEKDISEKVRTGHFVGDCFIYTNSAGRLNYYVGGEVMTLAHLSKPMYILGYVPKDNRVYLMDKQYNICSYSLLLSVLYYQTAIVRRDLELGTSSPLFVLVLFVFLF
jgi:hypothetical protein